MKNPIEARKEYLDRWHSEWMAGGFTQAECEIDYYRISGVVFATRFWGEGSEITRNFLKEYWQWYSISLSSMEDEETYELNFVGLSGGFQSIADPFWRVHEPFFEFEDLDDGTMAIINRDFVSNVDPQNHQVVYFGPQISFANTMSLDNFLLSLLGPLLLENNSLILHSSAFSYEGRAYCFFGPSGVGKSTLVQQANYEQGVQILGGDRIVLKLRNGQLWAQALPVAMSEFRYDDPRRTYEEYPVDTLVRLVKTNEWHLKPLTANQCVSGFLKESLAFQQSHVNYDKHLELAIRMVSVEGVMTVEFGYTLGHNFVEPFIQRIRERTWV